MASDSHINVLWISLCHLGSFALQHWVMANREGRKKGKVDWLEHRNGNRKIHMLSLVTSLNFLCEKKVQPCLPYILLFFKEQ